MNALKNTLGFLQTNTERDDKIVKLIERLVNLFDRDRMVWNTHEFNVIGNITVELKHLLENYPIEVQKPLKTILKEDLSMGEIKVDYLKLFHNINKVWKRLEEENF